jgi:hypothetical protein
MPKEYLAFVAEFGIKSLEDLEEGKEIELVVKDLTPGRYKYESRYVRAKVGSPEKLPGADTLWVRFRQGVLHPKKWAIKITKELGELPRQPSTQF